jgi:adenosylcobinamide-GDP ribazoletransferase
VKAGPAEAIGFLTRVPLPPMPRGRLAAGIPWFPIVGGAIGLIVALAYAAGSPFLPSLPAAALATLAGIVLTGALHEDGLADSADALGASSRDEALRVLRDPRHGTYGVLALAASLMIRVLALAALEPSAALVALPTAHAVARAAMVAVLATTPPARADGLGATFAASSTRRHALLAVGIAGVLGAALIGLVLLPALALVVTLSWLLRRLALRRLGGVTGDVLGAVEQCAEITLLVVVVATEVP